MPAPDAPAELQERAQAVFGCRDKAAHWLSRPNARLDGLTPLQVAQTPDGVQKVIEMLTQLDEGFFG